MIVVVFMYERANTSQNDRALVFGVSIIRVHSAHSIIPSSFLSPHSIRSFAFEV